MFGRYACARVIQAVALSAAVCAAAGCSGGAGSPGGVGSPGRAGSPGGADLQVALARIADTAGARSEIWFDDTAALVRLTGKNPFLVKGFAVLRGLGALSIVDFVEQLPGDLGVDVLGEGYAISAGSPPAALTLLAGGQPAALVTSRLIKLGWKHRGGILVGPPPLSGSQTASRYALEMAHVLASGGDVVFGGTRADLSKIGAPPGPTLAGDPRVSALAKCLGDVVAAGIFSGGDLGGGGSAAVAVGVRRPASGAETPHAEACAAWPSQAAAARYAADLRRALASGLSAKADERYSALLHHASVASIGGSQHVVRWQADTPGNADLVFQMADEIDLPALPDCARLSRSARARVFGCG